MKTMYRVEDKYGCTDMQLIMLQSRMEAVLKPDINEGGPEGYRITSLYFDDLTDSCLRDTVDGVNRRNKYRIRIYNDSLDVIKLEVKTKRDNRILKRSKTITREQMESLMRGECIEDSASAEDPATLFNLAIRTQGLRPKVIVAYERKAYVYEPGNVRITFDRNVRASSQTQMFGQRDISYDFLREYDKVLEVKYDEFVPGFLLQLLETGSMRQSAYSKYQLCRECAAL
ncbi:MAG: polyphosphate polymerase domain-containing protein [Lachnospiraceae bacterium]|nr:polyphosphate polymerase domain-containing protein [Lachnospiraceae bacterium]